MTETSDAGHEPKDAEARARRWSQVDEILDLALSAPLDRREAFLKAACRGSPALRDEVDSLLAHVLAGEILLANMSAALSGGPGTLPDSDASEDLTGQKVGRYEVGDRLGGGMAAVYQAFDPVARRAVVLKLTASGLRGEQLDEARLRLEREGFTDRRVVHPSMCHVLDSGRTMDGRGFLVLEFCEGRTLRDRLAEGPLGAVVAVEVAIKLASALSAAHAVSLIHRDVKPSNVMVADDGTTKLLDFGVAKVLGENLTRTGQVLGTLEYMAPEQVSAHPVGSPVDVWSLGLVLYECTTGLHPYRKASRLETIRAIVGDGSPRSVEPVGHPALDGLLSAMLDPDPSARPTAGDVEAQLAAIALAFRKDEPG